jgi:hypothetical protein
MFDDMHNVEDGAVVWSNVGISKLISTVFCISDSLNYCIQY